MVKKYHHFKDDKESTHDYCVISVVEDSTDAEKFEGFVSKEFMRSHIRQFVNAINRSSTETLQHIEEVNGKTEKYLTHATALRAEILKTIEDVSSARKFCEESFARIQTRGELDPTIVLSPASSPATKDVSETAVSETAVSETGPDLISRLGDTSRDLILADVLELANTLRARISILESKVNSVESAISSVESCSSDTLENLKTFHEEYADRLAYRLNKDTKDDSAYMFDMYLTFKHTHYDALTKTFKAENPRTSLSGIKIRGAHKTYESADKHAQKISKDDDYMDTYIAPFGKWIPFPIRPDMAENIVYREKELNDLLGARLEESERIKHNKRNKIE